MHMRLTTFLQAVGVTLSGLQPLGAGLITGATRGGAPWTHGKYAVALRPQPLIHIDTDDISSNFQFTFDKILLSARYPDWIISAGTDASGAFDVLQYDPFTTATFGGADFSVLYDDGVATPRGDY